MDILLPKDLAATVEYYPPRRPTSATCRFLSPAGVALVAPTCTVDTLSATIATVTDSEDITVTIGTGAFVAGRFYWHVSADGQESRTLLGQKDSTALKLEWPVARSLPEVNDTLKGARITATIAADYTATVDENYAVEWTTTHADGSVFVERITAHVVRAQARPAVDAGFVKAHMVATWPDIARLRTFGYFFALATRASERVWKRIRKTGRYLHLLWQAGDFEAAGRVALDIELSLDKLDASIDPIQHRKDLQLELDAEIEDVISSRPYDEDNSGSVAATEIRTINAIQLVRQ